MAKLKQARSSSESDSESDASSPEASAKKSHPPPSNTKDVAAKKSAFSSVLGASLLQAASRSSGKQYLNEIVATTDKRSGVSFGKSKVGIKGNATGADIKSKKAKTSSSESSESDGADSETDNRPKQRKPTPNIKKEISRSDSNDSSEEVEKRGVAKASKLSKSDVPTTSSRNTTTKDSSDSSNSSEEEKDKKQSKSRRKLIKGTKSVKKDTDSESEDEVRNKQKSNLKKQSKKIKQIKKEAVSSEGDDDSSDTNRKRQKKQNKKERSESSSGSSDEQTVKKKPLKQSKEKLKSLQMKAAQKKGKQTTDSSNEDSENGNESKKTIHDSAPKKKSTSFTIKSEGKEELSSSGNDNSDDERLNERQSSSLNKQQRHVKHALSGKLKEHFEKKKENLIKLRSNEDLSLPVLSKDSLVYLMQIPKDVDPYSLLDKSISLERGTKLSLGHHKFVCCATNHVSQPMTVLTPSDHGRCRMQTCQISGSIQLHRSLHLKHSSELFDKLEDKVHFPSEIKVRHPIFGLDYNAKIKLEEQVQQKLEDAQNPNIKRKKSKKKKKQAESGMEDEMIFKYLNSKAYVGSDSRISQEDEPLKKKKVKVEMNEVNDWPIDSICHEEISDHERRRQKKKKRKHKEADDCLAEINNIFDKKPKKVSRDEYSEDEVDTSLRRTKLTPTSKRDAIVNSTMLKDTTDIPIFDTEQSRISFAIMTPKKEKEHKKKRKEQSSFSNLEDSLTYSAKDSPKKKKNKNKSIIHEPPEVEEPIKQKKKHKKQSSFEILNVKKEKLDKDDDIEYSSSGKSFKQKKHGNDSTQLDDSDVGKKKHKADSIKKEKDIEYSVESSNSKKKKRSRKNSLEIDEIDVHVEKKRKHSATDTSTEHSKKKKKHKKKKRNADSDDDEAPALEIDEILKNVSLQIFGKKK